MQGEIKISYGRSLVVGFFLIFLFSLVLVHYYKIQIIEHDKWVKIADSQHHLVVKEPFHRGKIYCKGENYQKSPPLVMDVLTYHLYIDPIRIKPSSKKMMIEVLGSMLGAKDLKGHFYKNLRSRKIKSFLTLDEKQKIDIWWKSFAKEHKMPLNLLTFVKDYKRSYPYDHLLGPVLSTVYQNRDEKTAKAIPIAGIEKMFDSYLQGEIGKRYLMRSPKYTIDDAKRHLAPKHGSDIYLTINHRVQAICEEELKKGAEKVNAKGAMAVMMDPSNGEIIAMAQYPFFSPENYSKYFENEEKEGLTRPKMITDGFEPGSIMKVMTMAICLKANEYLLEQNKAAIFCPHEMIRVDNPNFKGRNRPLKDISPHKYLNMFLAIQKSSNIYPARMIEKVLDELGPKWYCDQLSEVFGLGKKTGIQLPYENPGMIPIYGMKYSNGKEQWSAPTPYSLAIGYNVMVNALQMVRAYSVFANGGYLVQPTLIDKIVSPDGKVISIKKNEKKKVLSKDIADLILQSLKYTTKEGGSSCLADIPGYSEGGKTSTSEKNINGKYSKDKHYSSFIGNAPAKNPKFVLIVVVDEPEKKFVSGFGTTHFGGKSAAPIFREIGKQVLKLMKVPLDDPYGFLAKDPRTIKERSDWYKESKELNAVYDHWNK